MGKRKSTTTGLEWLNLSMSSFNGSGYADKSTPETYVASYIGYKTWRKETDAVNLILDNKDYALYLGEHLCFARDAGHYPSQRNLNKFAKFYNPNNLTQQQMELL